MFQRLNMGRTHENQELRREPLLWHDFCVKMVRNSSVCAIEKIPVLFVLHAKVYSHSKGCRQFFSTVQLSSIALQQKQQLGYG